jgi:hypothetical protein
VGCGQFKRLWHIFVRGKFGPCATRQIFVRGQFAPGIDLAQPPKLRTARDEFSIQAAVAYLRARSVRTSRDPANIRARSVRTWKRFIWSSSTITKASNSPTPPFVVLTQRLHPSRDLPGHDSVPRLKDGLGKANHNADQILKPCFLRIIRRRSEAGEEQRPGIRNSLDRRQGDLYKGTREGIMPS